MLNWTDQDSLAQRSTLENYTLLLVQYYIAVFYSFDFGGTIVWCSQLTRKVFFYILVHTTTAQLIVTANLPKLTLEDSLAENNSIQRKMELEILQHIL